MQAQLVNSPDLLAISQSLDTEQVMPAQTLSQATASNSMTHSMANSLLRPPGGSQDEASAEQLIQMRVPANALESLGASQISVEEYRGTMDALQNGIAYLAEQVQWRTETLGRATHAQSERSELIMKVLENVDQQFHARQRWETDFQASVQREILALAEDMKLITLEMRTSSRVDFEHRLASMETSLENISSQVAYMRSHEDLHDEMEKIKTVIEHQAKVWEQAKNLLDQGRDVLPSYIVAAVDEHNKSLQVLSNGCVRTESRQEEAQEHIRKLERQVKHQADEITKLQTRHAEQQSQIEELKRVFHRSMGSSTEIAADGGVCSGQQQQPQQFLLTPEAERQTPSFGQQTAEAETVEDEWWGTVDRHGWPQGGFMSEPPELPASLSRSRQAPRIQQQDVMRPFYSHALGTDLTRNANVTGSQTAVPISSSSNTPMRSTKTSEYIQCDPEDSKGIPDNRCHFGSRFLLRAQVAASSLRRGHPLRPVGYPAQRRMEPWFAFAWSLAQWAVRTARQAPPALAQLPPTCRDALAHTALVCAGATPAYYPPGWGPWCLSWGWFCLGVLSGAAATAFLVRRTMPIRPHAAATLSSPPPWHVAATHVLSCAAGGPAELKALATQAGTSPEDLFCNLLREATAAGATRSPPQGLPPQASPTLAAPGPQPRPQRTLAGRNRGNRH